MNTKAGRGALLKTMTAMLVILLLFIQILLPAISSVWAATEFAVVVTGQTVNVRCAPGSTSGRIGTAVAGEAYAWLEETRDGDNALWYKIQYTDSAVGWITSAYSVKTERTGDYTQIFLDRIAASYGAVGVQVAVIKNGVVTDTYNYGWATKETDRMTSEHKIRTASISKVAVAVCAMKLQEQGVVDIDANIGVYWGENPYKTLTLENLLTHTSTLKPMSYSATRAGTLAQLKSADSYNGGTPGSQNTWMYNNYAVGVAGSTLEVAAGQTLGSYARTNIFAPLGMDAAFSSGLIEDTDHIATLYHSNGNVARSVEAALTYTGSDVPGNNTSTFAGGFICSAGDLAKLVAMLANDGSYDGVQVLTPESVEKIEGRRFVKSENGGSFYQCMPLRYKAGLYGESGLYYHTGNAYGVLALASYNPDTRDGVVVLTTGLSDYNTVASCGRDSQGIYKICGELAEYIYRYHGEDVKAEPVPSVPVQEIALNEQELSLALGQTAQLYCTVSPSDANSTVEWVSSSSSVIVSQNGLLTAAGYGTAEITASADGLSASCRVSVKPDISIGMLGASIRVSDPYGIRFGVQLEKNEFYRNADVVEYGTLIIGAGNLGDAELTLETPSIRRIKAENILSEDDNRIVYTGVLINIPASFFETNVTARGYIIYRDADGNETVEYSDTATKNFKGVAQAAYDRYSGIALPNESEQAIIEKLGEIIGQ